MFLDWFFCKKNLEDKLFDFSNVESKSFSLGVFSKQFHVQNEVVSRPQSTVSHGLAEVIDYTNVQNVLMQKEHENWAVFGYFELFSSVSLLSVQK